MKVPIVSNVSERLNANIVIITRGILEGSENKDCIPFGPNAAPNVIPKSANAEVNPPVFTDNSERSTTL